MKPLLSTVVALSLLLLIHAHPDKTDKVDELSETDKSLLEEGASDPQTRVERCTKCSGTLNLNFKSPIETLEALKKLPGGEVHTQESFEGCSSDKGCAGLKVKDGKIIEKFGDINAFKAASAANIGNEFTFHAAGSKVFEGGLPGSGPYWWMSKDSPFKNGGASGKFEKYSSSSSSSFSTGAGVGATGLGANAALDLSANPFLNGDLSKVVAVGLVGAGQIGAGVKPGSSFQSSSYESSSFTSSNKGDVDISQNPFLNGGIGFGAGVGGQAIGAQNAGVQSAFGAGVGAAQTGFGSQAFEANSQSSFAAGSGGKFGVGYTGSSPSPFTPVVPNVNLIQNAQKTNEFNFEQQQTQQNIDEAFQNTGNVQGFAGGDLQETCAGQGYVCVPKAQCNNGVVSTNGAAILQANTKKQYCNLRSEICCRIEVAPIAGATNIQGTLGVGSGAFESAAAQEASLFASGAQGSQGAFGVQGQTNAFGANGQTNLASFGAQGQNAFEAGQANIGAAAVNKQTGFGVGTGLTNLAAVNKLGTQGQFGAQAGQAAIGAGSINRQTGFGVQSQFGSQAGQTNIAATSVNRQSGFGTQGQFGAQAGQAAIGAGAVNRLGTQGQFGVQTGQTTIGATSLNRQSGYGAQGQFGQSGQTIIGAGSVNRVGTQGQFGAQAGQTNFGATSVNKQTGFGTGVLGVQAGQTTIGAGSINRQTGYGVTGSIDRQTGLGVTTSFNANRGQSTVPFGIASTGTTSSVGSTVNKYGSTNAFGSTIGSTLAPTTPSRFGIGQTNFIATDSLTAGSKVDGVYRPGAVGTVLKPGIPYLPPVDNTNSPSINTFVTTPRPFTTPKPTYLPPISSTSAPGYLPPVGEQTINRETRLPPGPNYVDGQLVLDVVREPPVTPGVLLSQIPSGCAAALKCTPIEFCTADGIISNTTVILSREQNAYRVPLTDCKDVQTGRIGKCCRDPFYTDPWPVNQLGKWVPNTFGGNDGKYVPDNVESSNNVREDFFRTTPKPIGGGGRVVTGGGGRVTVGGGGGYNVGGGRVVTTGGGGRVTVGGGGGEYALGGGRVVTNSGGGKVAIGGGGEYTVGGGRVVSTGGGGKVAVGGGGEYTVGGGRVVTTGGGGKVAVGGGGEYALGGGGQYTVGGGRVVTTGGGERVVTGGGERVVTGGGEYTVGGGRVVTTGGGGKVTVGGGGEYTLGGGGEYTVGGGGKYTTGGGGFYTVGGGGLIRDNGFGAKLQNEFEEREGSESVQRVFLNRYDSTGQCGKLNGGKPYGNRNDNEVDFGEIPWQAMVLLKTNKSLLCGGVITRPEVVITSAACVEGLEAKNVLIKGGEWKLGIDEEPLPFQIVQVKHILRHPFYKKGSLQYDVAALVLTENLRWAQNVQPICLPKLSDTLEGFYNGAGQCIVTGWGKQVLQTHQLGSIMHSINVSLVNPDECQAQLSQNYPHLLKEYNEDSCICGQPTNPLNNICRVDIGSALACTTGDGFYVMEGIYSWDSGCRVGNQIAAFYKFDLEWYEWSIGLIETTKYTITVTKVTSNSNSGITGVTGGGKYTLTKTGSAISGSDALVSGSFNNGGSIISSGLQNANGKLGVGKQITSSKVTQFNSGIKGGLTTGSFAGGAKETGDINGGLIASGLQNAGSSNIGFGQQVITNKVTQFQTGVKGGSTSSFVGGSSGAIIGSGFQNVGGKANEFNSALKGSSTSGSFAGAINGGAGQEQTQVFANKVTQVSGTVKGGKVSFLDLANQAAAGNGAGINSGLQSFDANAKGQFGFGQQKSQSQFSTGQVSQTGSDVSFGTQLNAPITKTFKATYTQNKVFQTEPKVFTYTTKPEIVTYTTKPEVYTYTTKPKIYTYTTKPEIVTFTFKPQTYTYTNKPQIIRYETSGSGTNPQYAVPEKSYDQFSELVSGHKHSANCKCHEGKK